ncbi:biopolymer transporter Tol [Megalodesulfovibrio paquesii]
MRHPLLCPLLCCALWLLAATATAHAAEPGFPLVYCLDGAVMYRDGVGGKPVRLGQGMSPSLSPDGMRVVWIPVEGSSDKDSRHGDLVLYHRDTGNTEVLVHDGGILRTVAWSPTGQHLLYCSFRDDHTELWTLDPGKSPACIIRTGGDSQHGDDVFEPVWAPDGQSISYHDMSHWYRVGLDGAVLARTPLTEFAGRSEGFTSADRFAPRPGEPGTILFSASVPGTPLFQKKINDINTALFLYDTPTRKITRLTSEDFTAFSPVWSPDGQSILFVGYTDVQASSSANPLRVFAMRPGATPVELFKGDSPMPAAGGGSH